MDALNPLRTTHSSDVPQAANSSEDTSVVSEGHVRGSGKGYRDVAEPDSRIDPFS